MDFRRELLSAKCISATKKKKAGNLFKEIINDNYILGQSLLFKRAYVKDISFDARLKYLNDYRFMVDLASEHVFLYISEPLVKYRVHGKNTISRDRTNWLTDLLILEDYILRRYIGVIPRRLKGTLYLKMGRTCSKLGQKEAAKSFYLKALSVNFLSQETILYLSCLLNDAKGLASTLLSTLYFKVNSVLELMQK